MHRGYVDAPWGQIHYRETGDAGAPAVLLYPNRPRSSVIYERLAGLLADRYRVIVIDPPGFGGSDPLPDDLEVPDLTNAVVVLLDALGVEKVRISGHHTGATICLDLAATHPERVVAIAPTGTLLLTDEERAARIDRSGFIPAAGNTPQEDGSHLQAYLGKYPPKGDEDLAFLNDVLIDNLVSEPYQMPSAQAVYRYPERERMAGITTPTLFVQSIGPGEPGTLQRAETVLDLIPGSRITYIDGGDVHFIHHRADELAGVLHEFFASVVAPRMRAAVLEAVGQPLVLADLQIDEPEPDEVLIRVAASGVCHSDHNLYVGNLPGALPLVLGHEVAGVVERVGSNVRGLKEGDRVVTCPSGFCGRCRWCMSGNLHLCLDKNRTRAEGHKPRLMRDGRPVTPFVGLGGFAEQMLVHHSSVATVPDAMPLDRAALLGCAVVTGFGSVLNTARVRPGQTVAVIGCGGVGLNVVQAARYVGASRIIAVDRLPAKLERATAFGATDVVDASAVDPVAAVQELTGGGVDHAFEVVGRGATIEQAFAMLGLRGTATVVGVARPADTVTIPALALLSEKRLQGAQMGSSRFPLDVALLAQLYLDGRIQLDALVSERIALDDVDAALQHMDDSTGARSVITF